MKQEIMNALTTKFPEVSATILGRIADKLAKTATSAEDVKTAVDGVTFQQILESYGDSRATEAQQTAVQNYEKKYGLKEGRKVDGDKPKIEPELKPDPDKGGDDLSKTIAAAIAAAMKPLQDEIANFKQGRVTETRRQKLGAVIDKLPENLRKGYNRISVDGLSDDEFDTLLGEVTTEVDGIAKETIARGAVMGRPFGNGGKNAPTGAGAAKEATAEDVAEDDRRIMAGEEPMPSEESGNYVPDVPEKFGKWIDKNTERIERAKSLPYFMRDNEKYIRPLTITPQARAGADEAQKFNEEMMKAADVPKVPKARTREEILAAAKERHAARKQKEIDDIYGRLAKRDIGVELKRTSLKFKNPDNITDEEVQNVIIAFGQNNPSLFFGGLKGAGAVDAEYFMANGRGYLGDGRYDMTGNYIVISNKTISLSKGGVFNPLEELKGAFKAISQGVDLTFNQEYALESLWHEIRHAQAIGWGNQGNRTDLRTQSMETINQFCARHSYGHFVRSLGGKAIHTKEVIERGYGYSQIVPNFQGLLKHMNVTQAEAYTYFKNIILKTPYEDIYGEIVKYVQKIGRYDLKTASDIVEKMVTKSTEIFSALLKEWR